MRLLQQFRAKAKVILHSNLYKTNKENVKQFKLTAWFMYKQKKQNKKKP